MASRLSVSAAATVIRHGGRTGVLPVFTSPAAADAVSSDVIEELTAALGLAADEISRMKEDLDETTQQVCVVTVMQLSRALACIHCKLMMVNVPVCRLGAGQHLPTGAVAAETPFRCRGRRAL
jgi:hypothetical protein